MNEREIPAPPGRRFPIPRVFARHPLLASTGAGVGLLLLIALAAPLFVDINGYKPKIEAAATGALGMTVRIDGRLAVGILPDIHLTATQVHVLDERGTPVGSVDRARFSVRLLPLLQRKLRVRRIELTRPVLSIERSGEGRVNVEELKKAAALFATLDGGGVTVSDGTVRYDDKKSGQNYSATGLEIVARGIHVTGNESMRRLARVSLVARVACREIRANDLSISALSAAIEGRRGVFSLKPVTMHVFGGDMAAAIRVDESAPAPRYEVKCSLPRFRIDEFLKTLWPSRTVEGSMDFAADLSTEGDTSSQLMSSASGQLSLRGSDLTLAGTDLDKAISRYESSQKFNLIDVGAVLLAGPVGLAVKRGYNFAGLFRGNGDDGKIGRILSEWRVEKGVVRATDVAMATAEHRIALQGGLDLPAGQFLEMAMAVVDDKGCATLRQTIHGPIDAPEVDKPTLLKSLAGPVTGLVKKAKDLLPLGPCEPFYSGSVPHPK